MSGLPLTASTGRPSFSSGAFTRSAGKSIRPFIIPVILGTAAFAAIYPRSEAPLVPWFLGLAVASFMLVLVSPALLLIPVLVTEFSTYGYFVPALGLNQRYAVVLAASVAGASAILRSQELRRVRLRRVLLPYVVLIALATVVNSIASTSAYTLQYLRYQVILFLAMILAACLIQSRRDLVRVAWVALAMACATAVASIWQNIDLMSAPLGATTPKDVRFFDGRSVGLARSPVALATQLILVLPPLIGVILCVRWKRMTTRLALGAVVLLLAAGLSLSLTRSAIFGFAPALLVIAWYVRGYSRVIILGALVAGVAIFMLGESTGLLGRRLYKDAEDDRSAASHQALLQVAFAVALDQGLVGIGNENFEEVSLSYIGAADGSEETNVGVKAIGVDRPHNDFLSIWLSWGVLALVAYLGIFIGTLRNFRIAARSPDALVRGLSIGSIGGIVVYAVNSSFHNSMDNSLVLWLYAGLSVTLVRLAAMPPPYPRRPVALMRFHRS